MNDIVYLQKSLAVGKSEKYDFVNNNIRDKNKKLCKKTISKFVNKIIDCKNSGNSLDEYHEFILDSNNTYFKLFFDIDYKTSNDHQNIDTYISEFKEFISIELYNIINKNYDYTTRDVDNKDIVDFIKDNIYITLSNNPEKLSLHVFFNQLLVTPKSFVTLKKYINNLKSKTNNLLIHNIDLAPFRKYTQLRFIYSKKNDSIYYHSEYNYNIENVDDLRKYILTSIDINNKHIIIESKKINEYVDNIGIIYPHIKYFRGESFIHNLYIDLIKNYECVKISTESFQLFKQKHTATFNETIDIDLVFEGRTCSFCGKTLHKNGRFVKFVENNIQIIKRGNSSNCRILSYAYPRLGGFELADFIKDLDIIKKIDAELYVFWKNGKWVKIDSPSLFQGITKSVLDNNKNNMILHDIEYMSNRFFNECKNRIMATLSLNTSELCKNPYIIQFNNGVYDIQSSKFYEGDDAKPYIRLHNIRINYKNIDNMSVDERQIFDKNYNILLDTFNYIIPENNPCRSVFEANLSSVLHYCHKPIITIFHGPASSGKSTIKALIRQLLFDMFIDIPIEFYQTNNSKNGPNAWLGKVEGKCVSFASEGEMGGDDKFLAKNIKQLTEPYINGRDLNCSKCVQKNTLTQFIDLNPNPIFSSVDAPVSKRIAIVELNHTHFVNEKLSRETINITSGNRNIVTIDEKFDSKIINNEFTLPLFYILKKWSNKHHKNTIKLLNTPDIFFNN
ncbi:NTPase, DNA primase [Mythimna separata entomopoxvirus 'L']|uniref:NTPase, DNA primase n=1 Tax=Mythimna separata entomopoxvirus 'L' TaxID=1293572 RepID=A0A916KQ38_9POXV|nr:NTPase, DNA primase [Mythimna separata entomopoxvirus 'L']CCU56308.1 NTPase, DNA primase [Mythimna separata entomopoxvirus 'L']